MYLAMLRERGLSDRTAHTHARAIKTLLIFWAREKYMPERVYFDMPRFAKKRLPVLSPDELRTIIAACETPRDRALIMLLADSGLRCSEVIALDWSDIDFSNGLLRVRH